MKKKKLLSLFLSLVMSVSLAVPAMAADDLLISPAPVEENYTSFTGTVGSMEKKEDSSTLLVWKTEDNGFIYHLSNDVKLYDAEKSASITAADLKEGDTVTVVIPARSPVALSNPPQSSSAVFVVRHSKDRNVFVGGFGEDQVSNDNFLKLMNLGSENCSFIDISGAKQEVAALSGRDALVLYTVSTRSIPAQTNPELTVLLPELPPKTDLTGSYEKDGIVMVPLRANAEALGFEVIWTSNAEAITLKRGSETFTVTLGSDSMGHNKAVQKLEVAPELNGNSTYVPLACIELMK